MQSFRRLRVSIVREPAAEPYRAPRVIRAASDLVNLLATGYGLTTSPVEKFLCLPLDARHRLIGVHECHVGGIDQSLVETRVVFSAALLAGAACIIVAHNHPSGDPAPSPNDREVTGRLREAGTLLGIEVLDHIIVGHERYFSFASEAIYAIT